MPQIPRFTSSARITPGTLKASIDREAAGAVGVGLQELSGGIQSLAKFKRGKEIEAEIEAAKAAALAEAEQQAAGGDSSTGKGGSSGLPEGSADAPRKEEPEKQRRRKTRGRERRPGERAGRPPEAMLQDVETGAEVQRQGFTAEKLVASQVRGYRQLWERRDGMTDKEIQEELGALSAERESALKGMSGEDADAVRDQLEPITFDADTRFRTFGVQLKNRETTETAFQTQQMYLEGLESAALVSREAIDTEVKRIDQAILTARFSPAIGDDTVRVMEDRADAAKSAAYGLHTLTTARSAIDDTVAGSTDRAEALRLGRESLAEIERQGPEAWNLTQRQFDEVMALAHEDLAYKAGRVVPPTEVERRQHDARMRERLGQIQDVNTNDELISLELASAGDDTLSLKDRDVIRKARKEKQRELREIDEVRDILETGKKHEFYDDTHLDAQLAVMPDVDREEAEVRLAQNGRLTGRTVERLNRALTSDDPKKRMDAARAISRLERDAPDLVENQFGPQIMEQARWIQARRVRLHDDPERLTAVIQADIDSEKEDKEKGLPEANLPPSAVPRHQAQPPAASGPGAVPPASPRTDVAPPLQLDNIDEPNAAAPGASGLQEIEKLPQEERRRTLVDRQPDFLRGKPSLDDLRANVAAWERLDQELHSEVGEGQSRKILPNFTEDERYAFALAKSVLAFEEKNHEIAEARKDFEFFQERIGDIPKSQLDPGLLKRMEEKEARLETLESDLRKEAFKSAIFTSGQRLIAGVARGTDSLINLPEQAVDIAKAALGVDDDNAFFDLAAGLMLPGFAFAEFMPDDAVLEALRSTGFDTEATAIGRMGRFMNGIAEGLGESVPTAVATAGVGGGAKGGAALLKGIVEAVGEEAAGQLIAEMVTAATEDEAWGELAAAVWDGRDIPKAVRKFKAAGLKSGRKLDPDGKPVRGQAGEDGPDNLFSTAMGAVSDFLGLGSGVDGVLPSGESEAEGNRNWVQRTGTLARQAQEGVSGAAENLKNEMRGKASELKDRAREFAEAGQQEFADKALEGARLLERAADRGMAGWQEFMGGGLEKKALDLRKQADEAFSNGQEALGRELREKALSTELMYRKLERASLDSNPLVGGNSLTARVIDATDRRGELRQREIRGEKERKSVDPTLEEAESAESQWKELPKIMNLLHPGRKFIHPDGREAIFKKNEQGEWILLKGPGQGTHNFAPVFPPEGFTDVEGMAQFVTAGIDHLIQDVLPWMVFDNGTQDIANWGERQVTELIEGARQKIQEYDVVAKDLLAKNQEAAGRAFEEKKLEWELAVQKLERLGIDALQSMLGAASSNEQNGRTDR